MEKDRRVGLLVAVIAASSFASGISFGLSHRMDSEDEAKSPVNTLQFKDQTLPDVSEIPDIVNNQALFNYVMNNMVDTSSDQDFFDIAKEKFNDTNGLYYSQRHNLDPSMLIRYYPAGRVGANPIFNFSIYKFVELDEDENPIVVFGVSILLGSDGYLNPNSTNIGIHTKSNLKRGIEKYFNIPEELDDVDWELLPDTTLVRKRRKFADRTIAVGGYSGGALFFNVAYNLNEKATDNNQPRPVEI